jgi:hypothetical protein
MAEYLIALAFRNCASMRFVCWDAGKVLAYWLAGPLRLSERAYNVRSKRLKPGHAADWTYGIAGELL